MGFVYSLLSAIWISAMTVADIPYSAVESAFSGGDAARIVSMGADKMMISVCGKDGIYASSQATQVLKDFFTRNPSQGFHFTLKGKESEDGAFAVGSYQSKPDSYRITLKWKKTGGDFKIESIRIDRG